MRFQPNKSDPVDCRSAPGKNSGYVAWKLELCSSPAHNGPTTRIITLAGPLQCIHQGPGRSEPKWAQQGTNKAQTLWCTFDNRASSYIRWSCSRMNMYIVWDTLRSTLRECWPIDNMWKQQNWSTRKACQSWRLWLLSVSNNTTSSYRIEVWCSVLLYNHGLGIKTRKELGF